MANTASAKKRARQAEKHRALNASQRSTMRTFIKKVRLAAATGDKAQAQSAFQTAVPVIDRMSSKGLIHKNAAARYKSALSAVVKGVAA